MSDLLKNEKHTIKLGDKIYELTEINLNILADIEDEFGCSIVELQEKFNQKQASTLRSLAWVMLKGKNPDLTREAIGENIDLHNLKDVAEKLFAVIKGSIDG